MYLGRVVESAPTATLFARPRHPYTQALVSAARVPVPSIERTRRRIVLAGKIPSAADPPSGCRFRTRCSYAVERCADEVPALRPISGMRLASSPAIARKTSQRGGRSDRDRYHPRRGAPDLLPLRTPRLTLRALRPGTRIWCWRTGTTPRSAATRIGPCPSPLRRWPRTWIPDGCDRATYGRVGPRSASSTRVSSSGTLPLAWMARASWQRWGIPCAPTVSGWALPRRRSGRCWMPCSCGASIAWQRRSTRTTSRRRCSWSGSASGTKGARPGSLHPWRVAGRRPVRDAARRARRVAGASEVATVDVRLVEVTEDNQRAVSRLATHHSQEQFVAPMAGTFADALIPSSRTACAWSPGSGPSRRTASSRGS